MRGQRVALYKINLDCNFNFGLKQANQERQRGRNWYTLKNKHILLLRRLKSLSKRTKTGKFQREGRKRINPPLKPSCRAEETSQSPAGVSPARVNAFCLLTAKVIVWSQSLLLTNATAVCCLDNSVYFFAWNSPMASHQAWNKIAAARFAWLAVCGLARFSDIFLLRSPLHLAPSSGHPLFPQRNSLCFSLVLVHCLSWRVPALF